MASILEKTTVLGYANADHLLRRTTYCPTKALINQYAAKTPAQALNDLFIFTNPVPVSPVDDSGKTLIATYSTPATSTSGLFLNGITNYVVSWWLDNASKQATLQYKLTFFLHSIFTITTADISPDAFYDYLEILRTFSKGSIKALANRITVDNVMLNYLGNDSNTKSSINENYGREFLELFTILKGAQVAAGNYTNYTENDVKAAAKVLTGFHNYYYKGTATRLNWALDANNIPMGKAIINDHDTSNKTFSAAFNNTVIKGATTATAMWTELDSFVNMVFAQQATAKSYARKLYTYFVSRNITTEVENDIITPLASTLYSNNYNLEIALKQLLKSKHFYDEDDTIVGDEIIGGLIKSPLELNLQTITRLQIPLSSMVSNPTDANAFFQKIYWNYLGVSGLPIFSPQTVAGYPAYERKPNFDKNWLNATTLKNRYLKMSELLLKFDSANFVRNSGNFSDPGNATILLEEVFGLLLLDTPISNRYAYFSFALLGGLEAANWKVSWNNYMATGNKSSVKIALDRLFTAIVNSVEYQVF